MFNLDIKYMNVDREVERSRNLEKQLDEMALSAERYSATTPENISDADQNHYSKWTARSGKGFAFDVSLLANLQCASSIDSFGQKRPKARTGKLINYLAYGLSLERRRLMKTAWTLVRRVNCKRKVNSKRQHDYV